MFKWVYHNMWRSVDDYVGWQGLQFESVDAPTYVESLIQLLTT